VFCNNALFVWVGFNITTPARWLSKRRRNFSTREVPSETCSVNFLRCVNCRKTSKRKQVFFNVSNIKVSVVTRYFFWFGKWHDYQVLGSQHSGLGSLKMTTAKPSRRITITGLLSRSIFFCWSFGYDERNLEVYRLLGPRFFWGLHGLMDLKYFWTWKKWLVCPVFLFEKMDSLHPGASRWHWVTSN